MEYNLENQTLTFFLKGEINSYNAEDLEKDLEKVLAKKGFKAVVLDLKDVCYISSAGLRIIVKLKQQYLDTSLVNVSDSVYHVLEMVGFENLVKITKLKK